MICVITVLLALWTATASVEYLPSAWWKFPLIFSALAIEFGVGIHLDIKR